MPNRRRGGGRSARWNRLRRAGFTLVELMVSITLTLFLLTLFAALFSAGNDALSNARGIAEVDQKVRDAITKMRRDLGSIFLGEGASPGHLFEQYGSQQGYLTIEENVPGSPPYLWSADPNSITDANLKLFVQTLQSSPGVTSALYRQGVDERGLPVEVDVDDVLAFTARLPGNSPENIFVGRVPVGSVLDNGFSPEARFDEPNNGLFTSPIAEVIYFLRPDRPYQLNEINNPTLYGNQPNGRTAPTVEGRLVAPATYTLYRRELLLLSEGQRRSLETPANQTTATTALPTGDVYPLDELDPNSPINQGSLPNGQPNPYQPVSKNVGLQSGTDSYNPSFYQHYDVSVYFGVSPRKLADGTANTTLPLLNLDNYTLRWNDPVTIRQRRNRYGMQWLGNVSQGAGYAPEDPDGAVPNYDHLQQPGHQGRASLRMYAPIAGGPAWHGRPTQFESTLIGSEGVSKNFYNPTLNAGTFSSLDFTNAAWTGTPPVGTKAGVRRRSGGDILLHNVLSFDVKVLNDDIVPGTGTPDIYARIPDYDTLNNRFIKPPDLLDWPAYKSMRKAPLDPVRLMLAQANPTNRVGLPVGNASRVPNGSTDAALAQTDFIDLGQAGVVEFPFVLISAKTRAPGLPVNFLVEQGVATAPMVNTVFQPSQISLPNSAPLDLQSIPWGHQESARWQSIGRGFSSSSYITGNLNKPLRSTYDSWAKEYRAEEIVGMLDTRFSGPIIANPGIQRPYYPPYDRPLRGIQIKLRLLEPGTGIEREFTIVQRFE